MVAARETARVPLAAAWLGRRLLLPALCASVAVDVLICVLLILPDQGWPPPEGALGFAAAMFALTIMPVLGGLLLFGLPAGLLVARLELGFGLSLFQLCALGAIAGIFVTLLTPLGLDALTDPEIAPIFACAGLVTAMIWTAINRDLFRLDDGA